MILRLAAHSDIDTLVKLRMDYLTEDYGNLSEDEINSICSQLRCYFEKHIGNDFIAVLAEEDGVVLSAAFLVIVEKPANPSFITGVTGTLLNVFTYPEYRKKGIASRVISHLLEEGKKAGVSSFDLFATESGKPLYEKFGFTEPKYTAMRLQVR
jgi:ribosomal protein S18 acetylase RimI-like enzyme